MYPIVPYISPPRVARAASFAYRVAASPQGRRAGRKIYRAFQRYRANRGKRARMEDDAPGSGKAVESNDLTTTFALRTMTFEFLPNPVIAPDVGDYNVRDKSRVWYSGYKICREFENRSTSSDGVYEVHYAIIQWKTGFISTLDSSGGLPTSAAVADALKSDFFRENGFASDRVSDFSDGSVGAQLWEMKYNCNSMNPNKNYKIITHKRFRVLPRDLATSTNSISNTLYQNRKKLQFYMRVKKRMNFKNRADQLPDAPFMEIWWYNTVSPLDWPASNAAAVQDITTYRKHHCYFRG